MLVWDRLTWCMSSKHPWPRWSLPLPTSALLVPHAVLLFLHSGNAISLFQDLCSFPLPRDGPHVYQPLSKAAPICLETWRLCLALLLLCPPCESSHFAHSNAFYFFLLVQIQSTRVDFTQRDFEPTTCQILHNKTLLNIHYALCPVPKQGCIKEMNTYEPSFEGRLAYQTRHTEATHSISTQEAPQDRYQHGSVEGSQESSQNK